MTDGTTIKIRYENGELHLVADGPDSLAFLYEPGKVPRSAEVGKWPDAITIGTLKNDDRYPLCGE